MNLFITSSYQKALTQRLFHCAYAWQGEEYVNQTFEDELNFDVEEIDSIYEPQEEQDEKA